MYAYDFDVGDGTNKDLLGGKGAGLATMTQIGLPVPPGFTVSTDACRACLADDNLDNEVWDETVAAIGRLEKKTGRTFGASEGTPLLLSVRSGAKFSMPGMMDTVLNLGLNENVVTALEAWSGSAHFAWDAYRRFVQTYGKVVLGVSGDEFEKVLTELRDGRGVTDDSKLTAEDLEKATRSFQKIAEKESGAPVPTEPLEQLRAAVTAVFSSWDNPRAQTYRRLNDIPEDLGTACNVQLMVFGDLGDDSGTGVCFTRDPATGEKTPYGDYLPNAQGEDVVAGIRRTLTLNDLAERHPKQHQQLLDVMGILERHYTDMCDIEFTIEKEVLYILQTRVGKRTAQAAVRLAVEMADEGLIDRKTGLLRVDPSSLDQMLHPRIDESQAGEPLATGVNASPGAATGKVVFDADTAVEWAERGEAVVLVRWETTPDDIHGLAAAQGVLTSHGGRTSHAAVVARGMGKPAVTGAEAVSFSENGETATIAGVTFSEGDVITIDGITGHVYAGALPLIDPEPSEELVKLLQWADEVRTLGVRANADTGPDAAFARTWGAEGIGLARTEHMFMGERLPIVQKIILEDPGADAALDELRRIQVSDFEQILEAMDGYPVIVRLLDPPLHEFLPTRWDLRSDRDKAVAAGEPTDAIDKLTEVVMRFEETNPMLGLRGVRLGLLRPELYRVQVQAGLEAVRRRVEAGGDPRLELMIPLVSMLSELKKTAEMIEAEKQKAALDVPVLVGTMIELPRAALVAAQIATVAEFFSFGTNDLTQTTFGFSRDDAEAKFLSDYLEEGLLEKNPFETLDVDGVGRLIAWAVKEGKQTRPDLEVGICGEHGGDPASIAFCHRAGLDYVSCSPPRVPIARLAAAQAALGVGADRSTV